MGIHEFLEGTDDVKKAVQKRAPIDELRELALNQGMTTLLQDGIEKCFAGHADVKHVRSVAIK